MRCTLVTETSDFAYNTILDVFLAQIDNSPSLQQKVQLCMRKQKQGIMPR